MTARTRWCWRLAVATAAVASTARAEPRAIALRVVYSAPAACPSRDAFVGQILARTSLARRALPTEPARTIRVSIHSKPARWVGTLSLSQPSGERAARRVTAASCADVARALALVAALAIDPEASTAPLPPPAVPAPKPATPAGPPAPQRHPAPPRPKPAGPVPKPLPIRSASTPRRASWRIGGQASIGVLGAITPGVAPEIRVGFGVERVPRGVWAPALFASGAAARASVSNSVAPATFTWLAGRIEACPISWRVLSNLDARPCLALDAGTLRAESAGARELQSSGRQTRLWLSGDGVLAVAWQVAPFLSLRASAGLIVPFFHDQFVFENAQRRVVASVHEVPPVSGFGELGLGFWF